MSVRKIVFDIETKNLFAEVGSASPDSLSISLVGVWDSETNSYTSYLEEELGKLWPLLEKADLLIGFNSDHFDIPLLNKYYPGNLTRIKSIDLLKEVKAVIGRRVKLDTLAQATLGAKKTATGLKAYEWWKRGEIDKIREYCLEDVRITKELYEYARAHGHLKYIDFNEVKEIPLDTSSWEDVTPTPMPHTLPW